MNAKLFDSQIYEDQVDFSFPAFKKMPFWKILIRLQGAQSLTLGCVFDWHFNDTKPTPTTRIEDYNTLPFKVCRTLLVIWREFEHCSNVSLIDTNALNLG